jgi:hypothetical protein
MKLYFLHRLKRKSTLLRIRHTIRQARFCPNTTTFAVLRKLIWPLHLLHFRLPDLLTHNELQESPEVLDARQSGIHQLMNIPLFRIRDTPLRSLYRIHDDLCAGQLILMSYESDYFFRQRSARWQLSRMPDPGDDDPVRYAILASLVDALVDAFNWRMQLGIGRGGGASPDRSANRANNFLKERPLSWTRNIGAIEKPLNLIDRSKEPHANPEENFLKRNIEAGVGYLYTV